jgi:hypothetical protein
VSITGHGRDAGNAMRVGLGDDAAAAGGLVGHADGGPVFIADAAADPLAGFVAADAVADVVASGGRWLVDVALARVAAAVASRAGDAHTARRPDESPGRPIPLNAAPFVLGAHTAEVLDDWLVS